MRIVQHYKGGFYRVIAYAQHTEKDESLVIYQTEQGQTFARPSTEFYGVVDVDGKIVPRFDLVWGGVPE